MQYIYVYLLYSYTVFILYNIIILTTLPTEGSRVACGAIRLFGQPCFWRLSWSLSTLHHFTDDGSFFLFNPCSLSFFLFSTLLLKPFHSIFSGFALLTSIPRFFLLVKIYFVAIRN